MSSPLYVVKDRAESWFAKNLNGYLSGVEAFPRSIPDDREEKIYAVSRVESQKEIAPGFGAYYCECAITLAAEIEVEPDFHKKVLFDIECRLQALRGLNGPIAWDAALQLQPYGWDEMEFEEAMQFETHGDVITFRAGFGLVRAN